MSVPNRGFTYTSRIPAADAGTTALAWLAARYPHSTAATWAERLAAGEVSVGDRVAEAATPLHAGDVLVWRRPPWVEPDAPLTWDVVHEDAALLVVDKPSGLPTLPSGGFLEHTLLSLVRRSRPEATPMHRLGTGTSGLVVFARTAEARARLQAAWRTGAVERRYRGLATGVPPEGPVEVPIGPVPHPLLGAVHAASPTGRPARSHVRVVGRRGPDAWVDVRIDTGRPHQIRVHLAALGHPLVGDPLFGAGGLPRPDAKPTDTGYLLHAHEVAFAHPATGERLALRRLPAWDEVGGA